MRLVDAEQIGLTDMEIIMCDGNYKKALEMLIDKIANAPTIEMPQKMRGKWIWKGEEGDSRFSCSVCKCREHVPTCNGIPDIWDFCPNCGADMREE